jgi:hypothetical protein
MHTASDTNNCNCGDANDFMMREGVSDFKP